MSGTNPLLGLNVLSNSDDPTEHLTHLLDKPLVAITGSRAATSYGQVITTDLVSRLARHDVTILTGGSYGIDAAVMAAAVNHDVRVVVLLASGLGRLYPAGTEQLLRTVVERGGALVSAHPDDTVPNRTRFVERTELMFTAADAVIVPESSTRSATMGGLQTVSHVPVYAVPGPVTSVTSAGPHHLIRSGRAQLLDPSAESIAELVAALVATR